MENLTDREWERIFKEQGLDEKLRCSDSAVIDAQTINKYRECRLMTKFDHSSTLPNAFREHNVNILPISRSEFLIGKFNAYGDVGAIQKKPQYMPIRDNLVTLPSAPEKITSEQTAIACAHAAGILSDFTQEESDAMMPTLSGRVGSGDFRFRIRGVGETAVHDVSVCKAQMEIDAVYETPEAIYLLEAKNHDCKDFIIRQLYYPYRYLCNLRNPGKKIIPIFMKYVNGTYHLYQYRFNSIDELDSMEYVRGAAYTFIEQKITANDMDDLLKVQTTGEPDAPFPQADTLSRVEDILNGLSTGSGSLSYQDIIDLNMDFTPRQADYYINAGKYLGLYSKEQDKNICLSETGKRIQELPYRERKLAIATRILSTPVFSECYRKLIQNGGAEIQDDDIISALAKHRPDLNETTAGRRAQTVKTWLKWITDLVDE